MRNLRSPPAHRIQSRLLNAKSPGRPLICLNGIIFPRVSKTISEVYSVTSSLRMHKLFYKLTGKLNIGLRERQERALSKPGIVIFIVCLSYSIPFSRIMCNLIWTRHVMSSLLNNKCQTYNSTELKSENESNETGDLVQQFYVTNMPLLGVNTPQHIVSMCWRWVAHQIIKISAVINDLWAL